MPAAHSLDPFTGCTRRRTAHSPRKERFLSLRIQPLDSSPWPEIAAPSITRAVKRQPTEHGGTVVGQFYLQERTPFSMACPREPRGKCHITIPSSSRLDGLRPFRSAGQSDPHSSRPSASRDTSWSPCSRSCCRNPCRLVSPYRSPYPGRPTISSMLQADPLPARAQMACGTRMIRDVRTRSSRAAADDLVQDRTEIGHVAGTGQHLYYLDPL